MQATVQHEKYGTITYEENFWTGKRELSINQIPLVRKKKPRNTFVWQNGDEEIVVTVKGSYVLGTILLIGEDRIALTPSPLWYEIVLAVLSCVSAFLWIGGAVGGAIGGAAFAASFYFIKEAKTVKAKVIIGIAMIIATNVLALMAALLIYPLIM